MSEDQIPHQISKCEKHYLQLHMECTTIITTSFQVDADGAQAKSVSTNPRPFHLTFWPTTRSVVAKKDAILRPPAVARRAELARAQSPNAQDGTMAVCASSRYPGNHRLCPCWFGNNTF